MEDRVGADPILVARAKLRSGAVGTRFRLFDIKPVACSLHTGKLTTMHQQSLEAALTLPDSQGDVFSDAMTLMEEMHQELRNSPKQCFVDQMICRIEKSLPDVPAIGNQNPEAATKKFKPPSSKRQQLTDKEAVEIFQQRPRARKGKTLRKGSMLLCKTIAPKYGVSAKTIRDIWRGRTRLHATEHLWTPDDKLPKATISALVSRSASVATPSPRLNMHSCSKTSDSFDATIDIQGAACQLSARAPQMRHSAPPAMPPPTEVSYGVSWPPMVGAPSLSIGLSCGGGFPAAGGCLGASSCFPAPHVLLALQQGFAGPLLAPLPLAAAPPPAAFRPSALDAALLRLLAAGAGAGGVCGLAAAGGGVCGMGAGYRLSAERPGSRR